MNQSNPSHGSFGADLPSLRKPVPHAARLLIAGLTLCAQAGLSHAQATKASAEVAKTALPDTTVTGTRESGRGYSADRSTSATKTDTLLRDTPQSISVINQDELRDRAVQSLAEAAAYVPGVGFAQGEGNRETPIFRGVSTTGDFFVDGVRDDVQYYRDLYNIDRVEVFKGPNAMIFGRGATGGLINRVSKQPEWTPSFGGSLTLGSHDNKRATIDINRPLGAEWALRLNAMHEDSGSYRDGVTLKRSGLNPTLSWKPDARTTVTAGYEYFKDERVADRGISSYQGRPVQTDPATFFGDPARSPTWSELNAFTLFAEHAFDNGLTLRNRTRVSDQDKFYQNVFPGATSAGGTLVAISAYNNATQRKSVFNQTDLTYTLQTGSVTHKLLAGVELGDQKTENHRNTGTTTPTSATVPVSNPIFTGPIVFSHAGTDANNSGTAKVFALYAQDQVELSPQFQVIAGLRLDRFKVDFLNKNTNAPIDTSDDLVSPRIGLIYKPIEAVSTYVNYSVAYQPRAGDQLASLSATTASFKPEKFKNYEIGAKWDIAPNLAATAAIYRLERSNVAVTDPANSTLQVLVDGQKTQGLELGLSGRLTRAWTLSGGYAHADAKFTANNGTTFSAGSAVAQVPKNTFTLWNRYDFTPSIGAGLGLIHKDKMYAATQVPNPANNVQLPGYTRVDAAGFFKLNKNLGLQLNVENLFDKKYYLNANSNTNITPGSPRAVRVTLNALY